MRCIILFLILPSLAGAACAGKDAAPPDDTALDNAEDTAPPDVAPAAGTWSFSRDPLPDRCEGDDTVIAIVPILPADTGAVSWDMELAAGAEGVTWEAEDGREVPCTVEVDRAHCVVHEEEIAFDEQTDVTIGVWLDGTLADTTSVEGVESWRMECEGESCATLERMLGTSFPCEASVAFSATGG